MSTSRNSHMRDIEAILHPYTNLALHREVGPTAIAGGKGIYVFSEDGRKYIEGMGGLWCTALGYGVEELIDAACEQMANLSFAHLFGGKTHEGAITLAEKIKQISPAPASKVFFTCSGSEANDTQIKLIWYYNNARGKPEKKKIISRQQGYHGVTVATASLTGLAGNHQDFDLPIERIVHTSCPHFYRYGEEGESEEDFASRMAFELERLIEQEGAETIAAFFAEPVMGAGGVIVPPVGYYEKIQPILEAHDILFVSDEVICGFGRTGEMFGSTTFGMRPDTISVAKALTSGYVPLGALTVPDVVFEACVEQSEKIGSFGHGFTYSGHPLGVAVALKTLEIYERDNIVAHVKLLAPHFLKRLKDLGDHPLVGEARGVGLLGGLELVADKHRREAFDPKKFVGAKAAQFIQDEGVILRPLGDTLAICPPLVICEHEVDALFDGIARGLDKTMDWAARG